MMVTELKPEPTTRILFLGLFIFLAAVMLVVAPLPLLFRSGGILFCTYMAFSVGGMPLAYITALLVPPIGLITGDPAWLILLPIVMSSQLLAMLGLEYAWRYAALIVSPLLYLVPLLFTRFASTIELLAVELPFQPSLNTWLIFHGLIAFAAMIIVLSISGKRQAR
jgi:hypothetical protein